VRGDAVAEIRSALLLGVLVAVAACADPTEAPGARTGGGDQPEELVGVATVLEEADHGPQLCLGGVAASLPPQCGGPEVTNWEWSAVDGADHVGGTRWGDYVVIGTYARGSFTLTRPAVPAEEYDGPLPGPAEDPDPWRTPCPAPEGGWHVLDPASTTDASLERVARTAQRLPGYAELWLDQSINPASRSDFDDEATAMLMNDPTKLVVNVRVTGDPAAAEAELRRVWGGALCVTRAAHTAKELRRIQRELQELPELLSSGSGRGVVDVTVVHDDGSLQRRLDEEYGAGLVRVSSALLPYPG
jgi:hypothetical protein